MAAPTLVFPPLDHSLLLPDLVDFHMKNNPSFPMFVYTNGTVPDTLTEITFLEFGRAAHRIAHALRPFRQDADGQVVMVIANTDKILHHAVVAGLSLAGWIPFPVSFRNSVAAVLNMMNKTKCSRIVTLYQAHKELVDGIRHTYEGAHLTVQEFPTLRYAFPKLGQEVVVDAFTPYPPSSKRTDLDSPSIYIHSSGSTGFPKAIALTHRIQIQWFTEDAFRVYAAFRPPRRIGGMALPPFHTFGISTDIYAPFVSLVTAVVYPPRTRDDPLAQPIIPTSDNVIELLKKIECNILMTVPTFLEQMAASEEAIQILKKIDTVVFGGGPLPVKVGEKLCAEGIQITSGYGGTEFGVPTTFITKQDIADGDWMWMRFAEDIKVRWVPQGDGTYELQILSTDNHQTAIENIPDVRGYATADIFEKHPTKDMWRIVGRADDVITLASGEKTVPAPMEGIIASSPLVQGVVMFGRARNQVGVLVEPRPEHAIDVNDEKAVARFRNQIWPEIEEANKPSPAFSRIFKEMILITTIGKPLLRAPKGTVQRKATLDAYEVEINSLYDVVEASSVAPEGLAEPSNWTMEVLQGWLLEHARVISPNGFVDPRADLFAQGFDSLSATYLRNRILGALRQSSDPGVKKAVARIPLNVIFENPTIELLGARVASLVGDGNVEQAVNAMRQHEHAIDAMIEKYSVGLDGSVDGVLSCSQSIEPAVVLLTGSTGGLGSFLLSDLVKLPVVQRVFAFNRPSSTKSIEERQKEAFEDKGLSIDLLDSNKIVHVETDASLEKCGLSADQYEEIRNSVTLIIHNAWRLDFNLALSSFEDNIRATRNLIDLGRDTSQNDKIRFLFTSSIGSAQGWDRSKGSFPEEVQFSPSVAVGAGYGEGKYVAERIIARSGLRATSLRIGQIAGGVGGSWAASDWFPIAIKSSVALGMLPEAAGVVSWLREEEVASIVLDTAFAKDTPPLVLNVVNPQSILWAEIIAHVRRAIMGRKAVGNNVLRVVPFREWFALLENKAQNASEDDLTNTPAIKLLEFFRSLARGDELVRASGVDVAEAVGMISFSTAKARRVSPTLANMRAIGEVEADAWVRYWISKGVV